MYILCMKIIKVYIDSITLTKRAIFGNVKDLNNNNQCLYFERQMFVKKQSKKYCKDCLYGVLSQEKNYVFNR